MFIDVRNPQIVVKYSAEEQLLRILGQLKDDNPKCKKAEQKGKYRRAYIEVSQPAQMDKKP